MPENLIVLLTQDIEQNGFTPETIKELASIGRSQRHGGAPHTGRLLEVISARLEGHQLARGPLSQQLYRGRCGHHWIPDESYECPICS